MEGYKLRRINFTKESNTSKRILLNIYYYISNKSFEGNEGILYTASGDGSIGIISGNYEWIGKLREGHKGKIYCVKILSTSE